MQHDEMIWQVINHQFCSFKTTIGTAKSDKTNFCRHPYSVTGLCNRTSCPLANSKYATIREDGGKIHLFVKTVERAHSPKNLWEKILLSRNYGRALQQLDEHLAYFPKALVHRNKQRLTKIHQYLIRMRKLKLQERAGRKAKRVSVHRKVEQREERREKKALVAAKLEKSIEKELVERLARGTYGDIYNFPEVPYQKALESVEQEEVDDETVEESEEEVDEEDEEGLVEYVEDLDEEEEEEMEDLEYIGDGQWGMQEDDQQQSDSDGEQESLDEHDDTDSDESSSSSSFDSDDSVNQPSGSTKRRTEQGKPPMKKKSGKRRRGTRVEIEYEEEREDEHHDRAVASSVQEETVPGMAW